MTDVKTTEHAYSHVLPELYGAYITLAVAAVGLFAFDWRLALASLWSCPVGLAILFGARRALQPMMEATRMRGLATSEDIQEALECVREVRATNQEERYLEHIHARRRRGGASGRSFGDRVRVASTAPRSCCAWASPPRSSWEPTSSWKDPVRS